MRKILVPTDFSRISLNALDYAKSVAKEYKSSITLLHVVESYKYNVASKVEHNIMEIIRKGVDAKLKEIVSRQKNLNGIAIDTKYVEGKIYKKIDEIASKENYDLIVMGTHGITGINNLEKLMLGTNAYRVVHSSPCPIITIKEKKDKVSFKNILLPLDVSRETSRKVELAIKWAKQFKSTIHLVSVSTFFDEYRVDLSKLKYQLKEVAEKVKAEGIKCTARMFRNNDIADSVLDYSNKINPDLIIIMTNDETKFNEVLLGSAARTIITNSVWPVLSVRPQSQERVSGI